MVDTDQAAFSIMVGLNNHVFKRQIMSSFEMPWDMHAKQLLFLGLSMLSLLAFQMPNTTTWQSLLTK
jgi:hypothetical protein